MITILEEPDVLSRVENPIAFKVATDLPPDTTSIYAAVWVESVPYSYTYHKLLDFLLYPDANGEVVFRVEDLLEEEMSYQLPDVADNQPQQDLGMLRRFILQWGENAPALADESFFIGSTQQDLDSLSFHAIRGGLPFDHWPTRQPGNPLSLSQKGVGRTVTLGQYEWLYVLPPNTADIALTYTVRYTDGTNNTQGLHLVGNKRFLPVAVPIGFPQRGYIALDPTKEIAQVDWVLPGGVLAATLIPEQARVSYAKEVYYFSPTAGSLESLICTGIGTLSKQMARISSRAIIPVGYTAGHSDTVTRVSGRRLKGELAIGYNIGANRSEQDYWAATEVLEAEAAYIRSGDSLIPIIIDADEVRLLRDEDYLNGFSFKYTYAQPITGNPTEY